MGTTEMAVKAAIRFTSRSLAFTFAQRCAGYVVMLGDDERFWVVSMADAARLERAGYDWAA